MLKDLHITHQQEPLRELHITLQQETEHTHLIYEIESFLIFHSFYKIGLSLK